LPEVRVAVVGVGNCASALVQGVEYYRDVKKVEKVPGLMHVDFGGYRVRDIRFVAAFEANRAKIGRDLGEAIFAEPNCCARFAEVPRLGVEVLPGPILDGVAPHMRESFRAYREGETEPVDVAEALREAGAEGIIEYALNKVI